jgi:hypothetical protein
VVLVGAWADAMPAQPTRAAMIDAAANAEKVFMKSSLNGLIERASDSHVG